MIENPASFVRVPTGLSGLDRILNGGLIHGGAYVAMGSPGAGKTTLGNQMAFHHVARGGRALYVTLLAESHARMLQHMQCFSFFDPKPIGDAISYLSGFAVLESDGLKGLISLLQHEIRARKASLLVVDGLVTAESLAPTETDIKKFVHELQTLLTLSDCTALLLTNPAERRSYPAHTMVDGIIELHDDRVGVRAERGLTVNKFRGSDYLRGRHAFEIGPAGLVVHPRIESLPVAGRGAPPDGQVSTGISQLDRMLGGGLSPWSSTLVVGSTGSGKTLLGLHHLTAGAERGEPGLYLGFSETATELIAAGRSLQLEMQPHVDSGMLELHSERSTEANVDVLFEQVIDNVRTRRVRRVFIDGLTVLKAVSTDPERVASMVLALLGQLAGFGITSLISEDTTDLVSPTLALPTPQVAARVENILLLRYVELRSQLHRLISVVKERGRDYDRAIREFRITSRGIEVASTFETAEAVLSGIARPSQSKPAPKKAKRGRKR